MTLGLASLACHERSFADAPALRGIVPGASCNATRVRTYVTPTLFRGTAGGCVSAYGRVSMAHPTLTPSETFLQPPAPTRF